MAGNIFLASDVIIKRTLYSRSWYHRYYNMYLVYLETPLLYS